ncbi:MAG TPA: hypothetical protein G4O04_03930 [Anaerolineae bacterium]|nr:hypothetical protein [Anaerolineae bacterium]HID84306.1 hypothetical protein [Anaerolineales bacterium]
MNIQRKTLLPVLLLALGLTALACSLPGLAVSPPTPFVFPTPNLTLTALFNPAPAATLAAPTAPPTTLATVGPASPVASSPPPAPTATTQPTLVISPTPVSYPEREPRVLAPLATSPLTIDGDWAEWPVLYNYVFNYVVFGADQYTGQGDLAGIFRVAWDADYLYLGVRVTDDRYVQLASGAMLYKGDSFEIQVDTARNADYFVSALNNDDDQFGFSPGNPLGTNPEAYRWYPAGLAGVPAGVRLAAQDLGNAYLFEVAVPWSQLQVTPYQGLRLGFCISLSDNDDVGAQKQQTLMSNCPRRRLTDPTTWGTLILTGAP